MVEKTAQNKIALFGGTFDPIHYGHLVCAESVRSDFDLDRILLVPCSYTARKGAAVIAPAEDRYAMTVLAAAGRKGFEVSRIELDREGPSYTIATVEQIRCLHPESSLHLIIGTDALGCIHKWRDSARLIELVTLIVMPRPGHDPAAANGPRSPRTLFARNPLISISSSLVRERLATGKSVKYLLPDNVIKYIMHKGLYIASPMNRHERALGNK